MGLGDLLDVDASHVAEQHQRALRRPVPDHAGVVLLLDLGFRVDEDAARHMAVDLELEDVAGMGRRLLGRVGELDAAGLHPTAAQHLGLDHRRPVDLLRGGAGLLRGRAEAVLRDGDTRQLDDLSGLELVEAHQRRGTLSKRVGRASVRRGLGYSSAMRRLTALAMVAAAALALGCGGTEIDAAKTEDTIKAELERSAGLKISEVDCPTGIEVEVDSTFECTLTADGEEKSA